MTVGCLWCALYATYAGVHCMLHITTMAGRCEYMYPLLHPCLTYHLRKNKCIYQNCTRLPPPHNFARTQSNRVRLFSSNVLHTMPHQHICKNQKRPTGKPCRVAFSRKSYMSHLVFDRLRSLCFIVLSAEHMHHHNVQLKVRDLVYVHNVPPLYDITSLHCHSTM